MEESATKTGAEPATDQQYEMAYDGNGNGKKWAFSDALNWAFNLLTAAGTAYALLNQPNQARDIAALTSRIEGDEKNDLIQFENRGHVDDGTLREMESLDSQKNLNMTNIARHESMIAAVEGNVEREIRDRQVADQEIHKEVDEGRQDLKRYAEERLRIVDAIIDRIAKDEQTWESLPGGVQKVKTSR